MTSAASSGWRKGTLIEPRMNTKKRRTAKPSPRHTQRQRVFSGAGMVFLQFRPERARSAVRALAVAVVLADGDELRVEVVVEGSPARQVGFKVILQLLVGCVWLR